MKNDSHSDLLVTKIRRRIPSDWILQLTLGALTTLFFFEKPIPDFEKKMAVKFQWEIP